MSNQNTAVNSNDNDNDNDNADQWLIIQKHQEKGKGRAENKMNTLIEISSYEMGKSM